jgi:adenosylcobinamide-GDP ribazoletransferase
MTSASADRGRLGRLLPDGLRLALTTLTVARVRGPREITRRTAGAAMSLAPLVGLGLGLVVAAVLVSVRELSPYDEPQLLAAALAVVTLAVLTRGLHLDGLADTVDGLASYRPADQARAVMRSPEVGPLGVVALVAVLLVQVTALYTATTTGRGTASVLLALVAGRIAVAAACTPSTPAADRTGLGAMVAGTVPRLVPVAWAGLLVTAGMAYEAFDEGTTSLGARGVDMVRPLLAVLLALLVAQLLRRHCVRRLGGVTGDVLGALVEVTTTVVLVVMALDLPVAVQQELDWIQAR